MIGIVLVTYFRRKLTEFAIKTLHETTKRSDIYLVVIDNNSPDDTPEMLTKMKERGEIDHLILNSENKHLGFGINQGLDALEVVTSIDYFLVINNDFFFMKGWLENAKKVMKDEDFDYLMTVYLNGVSNGKVVSVRSETTQNGGNFGRLTPRKPKKSPYDVGAGLFIKMDLVRKHKIRVNERKFGDEGYIGPAMDMFQLMQSTLKLRGARLHKPCLLLQDPEFNNPEYIKYYQYIHGVRGMDKTYRMYCKIGSVLDPKEYYRKSGYKISEFYSLGGMDALCNHWEWDRDIEKWE